jgi:hypothetical protein
LAAWHGPCGGGAVVAPRRSGILELTKWEVTCRDGGISYTMPAATASASYYKIYSGVTITWGWTLTSL